MNDGCRPLLRRLFCFLIAANSAILLDAQTVAPGDGGAFPVVTESPLREQLRSCAQAARSSGLISAELLAGITDGVVSTADREQVEVRRRQCEEQGLTEGEAVLRSLLNAIDTARARPPAALGTGEKTQGSRRLSNGGASAQLLDGRQIPRSRLALPIQLLLVLLLLTVITIVVFVKLAEMNFSWIFTRLLLKRMKHTEQGHSAETKMVVFQTLEPPRLRRLKIRAVLLTALLLLSTLAAVTLVVGKTINQW